MKKMKNISSGCEKIKTLVKGLGWLVGLGWTGLGWDGLGWAGLGSVFLLPWLVLCFFM